MSIQFDSDNTDTYCKHDTLASTLLSGATNYTIAMWVKKYTSGDYLFSLGSSTTNSACAFILWSGTNALFRFRDEGTDTTQTVSVSGLESTWSLYVLRFRTDTDNGYLIGNSLNGAAFGVDSTAEGNAADSNQLTIGAGRFNGTSGFSHCQDVLVAYPAIWTGHLTDAQVDELYGSGPSTGDAKAPWLVNTANLVSAQSWKDGTVSTTNSTVGTAYTLVNTNITAQADDNPTLIETAGGANRRRRRFGPMARS